MMNECKYSSCGAPLCPLDKRIKSAAWFPGEEVCHDSDLQTKNDWIKKQHKIVKIKGMKEKDASCFTVDTLNFLSMDDINGKLIGMDIDSETSDQWIHKFKINKKRASKISELEEKPKAGFKNKRGNICLYVGKKCIIWKSSSKVFYVVDKSTNKRLKTSKFKDVCEEFVKDIEKIKRQSLYIKRSKRGRPKIHRRENDESKGKSKDKHETLRKMRKEKGS